MAKPVTIAVAYASVGSGHRIASEAIAEELASLAGAAVAVESIDVLDYGSIRPSERQLTRPFTVPALSGMYQAVWSSPALGAFGRGLTRPLLAAMYRDYNRRIASLSPKVMVCTHALPALLASRAVRAGRIQSHIISVATDYGVHSVWPRDSVDLFCVASDESAETLLTRGFDQRHVAATGVPVRAQFRLDYDRAAARAHFGLPAEGRVILALAGSSSPGPYQHFKQALSVSLPAIASLQRTSVVIVCGNDSEFAEAMRSRAKGFGTSNVHVLGYEKHMAPLMAAADLAVGKPGGSLCAEALAMSLPLVLVGPAVGQELANATALTKAGAALFAADPRTIAENVRKAATRPHRLNSMHEAAGAFGRPFAARAVAEHALSLAGAESEQPELV